MAASRRTFQKREKSCPLISSTPFLFSILLVSLGAFLIFSAFWNRGLGKPVLAKSAAPQLTNSQFFGKPLKLYIPKLSKILAITDGEVIGDRWLTSDTGVSYLTTSALPGTEGNSVIYGHNREDILGALPTLTGNDLIYVTMNNGEFFKYRVLKTNVVQPEQVEILDQTKDFRLTVYTCYGFLDQARFVVVSELETG